MKLKKNNVKYLSFDIEHSFVRTKNVKNEKTEKNNLLRGRLDLLVCAFLAVLIFTVYFPVKDHEFVSLDDNWYVADNYHVRSGLTFENIKWSFKLQKEKASHWHPVTWMSHMLDCSLFGLDPGKHHLSSLFIHTLTAILLFLLLNRMTGMLWRSFFVAALFGLHPLSVNSVAWIAERKNVLSAFFWAATLLAYYYYVKRPSVFRYLTAVILFVLGLMSKPVMVTLPFVLLLLDLWPLERPGFKEKKVFLSRVFEKIPFFLMTIIFLFIYNAAFTGDNIVSMDRVPFLLRVENGLVSYVLYLGKILFPGGLAVYYPYPQSIPFREVLCSGTFVLLVSLFVCLRSKISPYLFTGWFWYLGTLVPAIGLKQVGLWPAMADRFVYVPMTGVLIIFVWGFCELVSRLRYRTVLSAGAALLIIILLIPRTSAHLSTWKDSISLFENDLKVTRQNYIMHSNLGLALEKKGEKHRALLHYEEALRINPNFVKAHNNLGKYYLEQGEMNKAIRHFRFVLEREPGNANAHNNLGTVLAKAGRKHEAAAHFLSAVDKAPGFTTALINLCAVYIETGDFEKAILYGKKAVAAEPDLAKGYYYLGLACAGKGRADEAIGYFSSALALAPDMAEAHTDLAISFIRKGMPDKAVYHFRKVLDLRPDSADAQSNLGLAYFKAGRVDEAYDCYVRALQIEPDNEQIKQNMEKILAVKGGRDN